MELGRQVGARRLYEPAVELEEMLLTRRPEEIFAAEDETDWEAWVDFFSRTREPDGRRKGLVEIRDHYCRTVPEGARGTAPVGGTTPPLTAV